MFGNYSDSDKEALQNGLKDSQSSENQYGPTSEVATA
jgi:hypothetical protein